MRKFQSQSKSQSRSRSSKTKSTARTSKAKKMRVTKGKRIAQALAKAAKRQQIGYRF